ncbi:50S ribosomal protein L3 [Candidatus Peregrinibacteria bacterium]|nr:50S ribosomal protein L3 [Candidatus Peregrinibacteria bacterium]
MMAGILGKKIGMTRLIQDDGRVIPITVVQCTPNTVDQIKTVEKDGYPAIVLGFDALKKPTKTVRYRHLREFKTDAKDLEKYKKGDAVTLEILKDVKEVTITGTSKGKGFQGVIKRYGFTRGPMSHGSHQHREPGSIGTRAKPGRVIKGKRMPGHMGLDTVTIKKVKVIHVDPEKNLLALKGAVPGSKNGLVIIGV